MSTELGKQSHDPFLGLFLSYFMCFEGGKDAGDPVWLPKVDWKFCLSFLVLRPCETPVMMLVEENELAETGSYMS